MSNEMYTLRYSSYHLFHALIFSFFIVAFLFLLLFTFLFSCGHIYINIHLLPLTNSSLLIIKNKSNIDIKTHLSISLNVSKHQYMYEEGKKIQVISHRPTHTHSFTSRGTRKKILHQRSHTYTLLPVGPGSLTLLPENTRKSWSDVRHKGTFRVSQFSIKDIFTEQLR